MEPSGGKTGNFPENSMGVKKVEFNKDEYICKMTKLFNELKITIDKIGEVEKESKELLKGNNSSNSASSRYLQGKEVIKKGLQYSQSYWDWDAEGDFTKKEKAFNLACLEQEKIRKILINFWEAYKFLSS